jgi:hypothetical protein
MQELISHDPNVLLNLVLMAEIMKMNFKRKVKNTRVIHIE